MILPPHNAWASSIMWYRPTISSMRRVKWAAAVEPGCHPAYAFSKRALQATTLRAIDDARRLDLERLAAVMTDTGSLRAHARRYRELKGRAPSWSVPPPKTAL